MAPASINAAKSRHPQSFGWLRRPDLDQAFDLAWEQPDGTIRRIPKQHDLLLSMDGGSVRMVLSRRRRNAGGPATARGLIARCLDGVQRLLGRSARVRPVAEPASRGAQGRSPETPRTSRHG